MTDKKLNIKRHDAEIVPLHLIDGYKFNDLPNRRIRRKHKMGKLTDNKQTIRRNKRV